LGPLDIVARPSAGMLLRELGLPMDTFSAVLEAVQQGRWRTARNPKAYVKTVARREFKKMAPPTPTGKLRSGKPGRNRGLILYGGTS
jgi:hypothetical protein